MNYDKENDVPIGIGKALAKNQISKTSNSTFTESKKQETNNKITQKIKDSDDNNDQEGIYV